MEPFDNFVSKFQLKFSECFKDAKIDIRPHGEWVHEWDLHKEKVPLNLLHSLSKEDIETFATHTAKLVEIALKGKSIYLPAPIYKIANSALEHLIDRPMPFKAAYYYDSGMMSDACFLGFWIH